MKSEELYEVLGDIDEQFIAEARKHTAKPRAHWAKRAIAAACIVLVAGVAVAFSAVWRKNRADGTDGLLPLFVRSLEEKKEIHDFDCEPNIIVEYNDAYYEVFDMSDTDALDRYNLPHSMTADMVGEQVAEVSSGREERFTLYRYVPYDGAAQRAVYVAACGGQDKTYSFAVFCNYIHYDPNLYDTAQEMFAVIGVYAAEDIVQAEIGDRVLDSPKEIARFYDLLCHAEAMGEDDFQRNIFGGMSENQQQDFNIELADTAMEVKITTKHGYCACWLTYEPKINYIDWACNHYKLTEPLDY